MGVEGGFQEVAHLPVQSTNAATPSMCFNFKYTAVCAQDRPPRVEYSVEPCSKRSPKSQALSKLAGGAFSVPRISQMLARMNNILTRQYQDMQWPAPA